MSSPTACPNPAAPAGHHSSRMVSAGANVATGSAGREPDAPPHPPPSLARSPPCCQASRTRPPASHPPCTLPSPPSLPSTGADSFAIQKLADARQEAARSAAHPSPHQHHTLLPSPAPGPLPSPHHTTRLLHELPPTYPTVPPPDPLPPSPPLSPPQPRAAPTALLARLSASADADADTSLCNTHTHTHTRRTPTQSIIISSGRGAALWSMHL